MWKTEADPGVLPPQGKECLELPGGGRGQEGRSWKATGDSMAANTWISDFWPPEL